MKRAGTAAVFTAVSALCMICMPSSAFSASGSDYSALITRSEDNGVLSLGNGEKWYRVNNFESGKDYIISVKNSNGTQSLLTVGGENNKKYVWHYYRTDMVASTTNECITLNAGSNYLVFSGGSLYTYYDHTITDDLIWQHNGKVLCCSDNGTESYLRYDENSDIPFSCTHDLSEAAAVDIYTNGDTLERCIVQQPHAESYVTEGSGYSAPVFSVELSDVTPDSVRWFTDGIEQPCSELSYTADTLTDLPSGIHHVSCIVEAHDSNGVHYREKSADALFVIAKGVVPDSVMTFSDIHEEYYLIDEAIDAIMKRTDGRIPSLIICTGDLVNGPQASADTMLNTYYPRIVSHLGGIDAVFVSGNHDSGEAASAMSFAAGLGAGNNPASGGMIFNGRSSAVAENGKNSRFASGIKVYGMNFEGCISGEKGNYSYSYNSIIDDVENFLKSVAEDYHGELLIISAHSGLHVLGKLPSSVNLYNNQITEWMGDNAYNIDNSYELAEMINRYAREYNMDIIYLFGHDHSRLEKELIISDGDTLLSPVHFADRSYGEVDLDFTYAHSGYLSTVIGSADSKFSFIYRDGDKYSFDLIRASDNTARHDEIDSKYIPAEEPSTASDVTGPAVTTSAKAADHKNNDSPKTGDNIRIIPVTTAFAALLLICKKKKR